MRLNVANKHEVNMDVVFVETVGHPSKGGRYQTGEVDEQRQSQNLRTITGIKFG